MWPNRAWYPMAAGAKGRQQGKHDKEKVIEGRTTRGTQETRSIRYGRVTRNEAHTQKTGNWREALSLDGQPEKSEAGGGDQMCVMPVQPSPSTWRQSLFARLGCQLAMAHNNIPNNVDVNICNATDAITAPTTPLFPTPNPPPHLLHPPKGAHTKYPKAATTIKMGCSTSR